MGRIDDVIANREIMTALAHRKPSQNAGSGWNSDR
jgi:hypothetical protein